MVLNGKRSATREGHLRADEYSGRLIGRLWEYANAHFSDYMFDGHRPPSPPIFTPEYAQNNVLLRPGAGDAEVEAVLSAIPQWRRHRFFGSMKSAQPLAQSMFGNLVVLGKMDVLSTLAGEAGKPLFSSGSVVHGHVAYGLERGAARPGVDVLLTQGSYRIAVECKLAEPDFGRCSRPLPKLGAGDKPEDAEEVSDEKRAGPFRCSLAGAGPGYWGYIPTLFPRWAATSVQCPCPLNRASQLTRSLLAACVRPDFSLDTAGGHTVLVYDGRNPSFTEAGEAGRIYRTVKSALGDPGLLQRVTWQEIVACLRQDDEMTWLVKGLAEKYGIE